MHRLLFLIIVTIFILPNPLQAQPFSDLLFQQYETYKEPTLTHRRFKHRDIAALVNDLDSPFEVRTLGQSVEGQPIYLVKIGSGETKVLLWSQMHGNEPTATMAIMDIFNFFEKKDGLADYKKAILENTTLYFIPMLNPDGANKYQRRNALDIDLNRDAQRQQTPEGRILKDIRDELQADWGFNLHDQSRYYSVGTTNKTATISFLAPAFNYAKDINAVRKQSIQLIGLMNQTLQKYMLGHVAKYNDTFEPRAFGDNIQKWGTSTILIESGGYKNDPEKQFIRKMNFIGLLTAFYQIAERQYATDDMQNYESIPFNARYFHELVIRNATAKDGNYRYLTDVAFRQNEIQFNNDQSFYYRRYISDLGDLSTYHGYHELDATGHTIVLGKHYPKTFKNVKKVRKKGIQNLLEQGYSAVRVKEITNEDRKAALPITILRPDDGFSTDLRMGGNPSFFLEKNGEQKMVVVNGQVFELEQL
ncbi:MAG: M14 family zinc carboxypeptidase [Bacteroidota bacterium]